MKTVLLVLLVSLLSDLLACSLFSQNTTIYQKGRIVTTDGIVIPFEKAAADGALFHYINEAGTGTILAEYVAGLDLKKGTKAPEYALRGGFLGLALGTLVSIILSKENQKHSFFLVTGVTGLTGGIFGGLIGSDMGKYKAVYINPIFGDTTPAWRLEIAAGSQPAGLTLRMSF